MKNIKFGNYLYELRKENNLTQRFVAYQLGVSDKAVSKWEMGNAKPDLDKLKLLAALYNVSFNDLLNHQEEQNEVKISKIVITGGPHSGKKTALSRISNHFYNRGYTVIVIEEASKGLIQSGITPTSCKSLYDYQAALYKAQKEKEKYYETAVKSLKADKVLIICERGLLDIKAYMKDAEFKRILKENSSSETKTRDSYDAVFHLVSIAKGKEEVYDIFKSKESETIEENRKIDDRIISSWTGHPHLRIIDNSTDLEGKIERLIKEISGFLGVPEPYEIERKFLIEYPNIKALEKMPNCTRIDITQTYLKSNGTTERRIRTRGSDGDYLYYFAEKRKISNVKRVELERKITQEEYVLLLMEADHLSHTIRKTRYCLSENNQYFEIDIYPEWQNQAIMEIELNDEKEAINVPKMIKIIKEVTEDESYKNYNMSKNMPKE